MAGPRITRRQLLAAGAGSAAMALLGDGGRTIAQAASVKPAGSDIGAIEHVVFLVLENRSFDHYFGSMSGVRGFGDTNNSAAFTQVWPGGRDPTLVPFHLDSFHAKAECQVDLSHNWGPQHECWNGGAMDSFVSTHTQATVDGATNGVYTMGYYERADLAYYYGLADAFTVCDGYHCSVFGPTHPNRLFAISGTNDPDGVAGGPVLITNANSDSIFSASWRTMPDALTAAGISWKVYNPSGSQYLPTNPNAQVVADNIMLYFKQYSDRTSEGYWRAFLNTVGRNLVRDIRTNELPMVSWVVPPAGYDEHPPAPSVAGEWFTHKVLSLLTSNKALWAKTALFVTYDENDGLFDHVPPPTAPSGTAGEYVTVSPLPATAGGIAGPIGLGVRVPMLVISPFSRGGFVCSDTFDHTSMLRFLETLFGVTVPNLSAWRRSVTGDLTATLQAVPNTTLPKHLPRTLGFNDPRVEANCPAEPLPIQVPSPQVMPTQESLTQYPRTPTSA